MKKKRLKIVGIILAFIAGLMFVGFAIYVFRYYPREAESYEINTANPTKKILIASQGGKTNQPDPLSPKQTDHWKPGSIDPLLFDKNSKELFLSQRA